MKVGTISFKETFFIGLMLFAIFFGAGNLIFPLSLGQAAGTELIPAIIGFLMTGVGLPLLGVIAIGMSKNEDVQSISSKVHPLFGLIFPVVIYLTIGPLFAVPRTGTVSYEIGVAPFLSEGLKTSSWGMVLYSIIFFTVTYLLALNPGKVVDTIGKILTPVLLIILAAMLAKNLFSPLGEITAPLAAYEAAPFFKGFQEGYLTMDTIGSFIFGLIVINAIRSKGIDSPKQIAKVCTTAGLIAAAGLGLVYVGLAYSGASSVQALGHLENGGLIISRISNLQFGVSGSLILSVAIIFACLTTSIGLVVACASFFHKLRPSISYRNYVLVLTLVSALISNVGLTQIISFSIPVLVAIYPIVIVLIMLTLLGSMLRNRYAVYTWSVLLTGIVSIVEGFSAAGFGLGISDVFARYLPFYSLGMGWVIPALVGGMIGFVVSLRQAPYALENE
ncbi:branched-chain amino acid transport system II carrier protein [Pontibacter amylolyticus]|uniref:Branched-chain amino acid transport system carrier protein n=1 Tax=Pontibacter amylolyticus TaxID=1424080 RepID=A0ABQ1WFD3_9BACT|nr:branched-chain amino acid transport system II carrier protein [Pontibacter amylolyticus]GGG26489.1 branched-chain amino acid transport system carrier protein [Pontibacter amylolyticus]